MNINNISVGNIIVIVIIGTIKEPRNSKPWTTANE